MEPIYTKAFRKAIIDQNPVYREVKFPDGATPVLQTQDTVPDDSPTSHLMKSSFDQKSSFRRPKIDIQLVKEETNAKNVVKTNYLYLVGSFTDWKIRKMYPLSELIGIYEKCREYGSYY